MFKGTSWLIYYDKVVYLMFQYQIKSGLDLYKIR
ncbi:hypothetical protein J2T02_005706 [Chitinophaga terrae (ex Kim and Jung 2007)]|nr:hypothetical protein [Chitinophaga terrae (ex Kim and Jung 2007)]